ncbi:DUF2264 domain-containing protein [Psychromicrobium xiongbiense]|uniref:DUF2264 domain-containing protein n=1 Tax=Psychromicrobium xiongbiense TaxID=3051184 RepID=UPI0025541154|nr:DUF2264 domain-containing protein [Psychromicrobium sp. YIM S02556]
MSTTPASAERTLSPGGSPERSLEKLRLDPPTAWTREHWWRVADEWLRPIREHASPGHALPVLPGRVTRDGVRREGMESIGRSLLMVAPRLVGAFRPGATAREAAGAAELAAWYRTALVNGTSGILARTGGTPGPEAWPLGVSCRTPLAGVTNSIVEAANIAFSLGVAREQLWDPLTPGEKSQVAAWLRHHAQCEVWQNNWQLFPAMAEAFLRLVGEDTRGLRGAEQVARVEGWYAGDGWYTDGPDHAFDYYNAWAIHPYLWAWYQFTGQSDTPQARRHLERLGEFSQGFRDFVADDGSPLYVGRSLTYRTAMLAALWCAELSGVNSASPAQTRLLTSSVLSAFASRGVGIGQPLSLGWWGSHEDSTQSYSGFGSPYLAGIGFLGLALPADHAVWTVPLDSAPVTTPPVASRALATVGWNLSRADGIVRLSNHGSDHCWLPVESGADPDDPHYAKFAYSSHTGPGTGMAWQENIDGHLALVDAEGRASRRCGIRAQRVDGPISGSAYLPQLAGAILPGTAVLTVSVTHGAHELRCHLVHGGAGYTIREGGFALPADQPLIEEVTADAAVPGGIVRQAFSGQPGGWRQPATLEASVFGLHGWQAAATRNYTGCHALGEYSATPYLTAEGAAEPQVYVALHTLRAVREEALNPAELVELSVQGTRVQWRWLDEQAGPAEAAEPAEASGSVDLATFLPWDGAIKPFPAEPFPTGGTTP